METEIESKNIAFEDFLKVDMRIGKIIDARINEKALKPAFVLKIDFGKLGIKNSSAQITENYTAEKLIGQQIIAVVNFPPKKVAGVKSEVLVLAAVCRTNGTVLLQPLTSVKVGTRIL
jgi:tRNA-binding protein